MSFGEYLRGLRAASGHRLLSVESATGISKTMLSRLENGRGVAPRIDELRTLAAVYGVPLSQVVARYLELVEPASPDHPDGGSAPGGGVASCRREPLVSDPPGTAGHGHTDTAPGVISPDAATGRATSDRGLPAPHFHSEAP